MLETQNDLMRLLGDQDWRLRNLYKIKDKQGRIVDFEPNWAQLTLRKPHYLNIVLKARQLGITTYHALLFLDTCLFNHNVNAAIVADSKPIAREIFIDKVKFAYDNLPQFVRDMCPAYRDNVHEMRFSNGSVFRVATSLRGGTLQLLHITEFAKICQENPSKANEIVSGALNAVQAGQFVCIESTARGKDGHFFNLCKTAQALQDAGKPLGKLDWKLWFFPWWGEKKEYSIDSKNVLINKDMQKYFEDLESKGIILTPDQKAWYVKKAETQTDYMKREFPSTPEEAFESANEGFYFAKQITQARHEKRICYLPYDDNARTYSSWDIGNDCTAIWVFQVVGKEIHFIDYYENSDEKISHFVNWLKGKPYIYEKHFLPHDACARERSTLKSYADIVRDQGLKVTPLERDQNELFGIECLRNSLPRFFFDEAKCAKGLKSAENFRKEWNEKLGCYRERSYHDWASHGTKALIYAAEAIQRIIGVSGGMTAEEWNRMRKEWI